VCHAPGFPLGYPSPWANVFLTNVDASSYDPQTGEPLVQCHQETSAEGLRQVWQAIRAISKLRIPLP
jgi:hypothetical protein